jgi:hypothetical protein
MPQRARPSAAMRKENSQMVAKNAGSLAELLEIRCQSMAKLVLSVAKICPASYYYFCIFRES